jgi:hypothetical protein
MIRTTRDAEVQISIIQKDITYLKTKITNLENKLFDIKSELSEDSGVIIPNSNNIDSILTSDGTIVTHRLYHIFNKAKIIEVVP